MILHKGLVGVHTCFEPDPPPSSEPAIAPPPQTDEPEPSQKSQPEELSKGQTVVVKLSGCLMDGVRTRVRSKAKDKLGRRVYQLDYRVGGEYMLLPIECLTVVEATKPPSPVAKVIRATAAQLREVLGAACPFVGPGLWPVKRSELPAPAWEQLVRLVEDG